MTTSDTIESPQDAVLQTESLVFRWFEKTDSLIATGIVNRVARGLLIHNKSSRIDDTNRLGLLLKKLKISKEQKTPISVYTRAAAEGDIPSHLVLSMRVPDVPAANTGSLENLATLIKFACAVTGADQQKVKIVTDPTLGNTVILPAFQQKLLNEISVAAVHSQGICTANVYQIKEGVNANPVEMLGLLKVLLSNMHLCRRTTSRSGKNVLHLEPSEIREAYNTSCGLKTAAGGWVVQFITEALAYAVRPNNDSFPGSFIHAAKVRFGVKSSLALLQKIGWSPLVPTHIKGNTVVYNKTRSSGKIEKIVKLPSDSDLDFVEHRTLVALCLPKINPKSNVPFAEQVRRDSLSSWDKGTLKAFSRREYVSLVDALVLAFNIYNSCSDTKSRATPVHFKNVRNEVLRRSAFIPLIDATGTEYSKFSELPDNLKAHFNKEYRFKHGASKRARSPPREEVSKTSAPAMGEPMVQDQIVEGNTPGSVKLSKEGKASLEEMLEHNRNVRALKRQKLTIGDATVQEAAALADQDPRVDFSLTDVAVTRHPTPRGRPRPAGSSRGTTRGRGR
jgi:hypothetical protein